MSGIADVARLAQVSKSTASRALTGSGYVSPTTRERVRAAADELGYLPSTNAASLVTGRTHTIALIVPRVNRWYFGAMIEGIERSLIPLGYDLTLYVAEPDSDDGDEMYSYFLARKRFDGLIALSLEPDDDDVQRLIDFGKPTVCVGNSLEGISTIGVDNTTIGRTLTRHLIGLGHRDIAFLGATPGTEPTARDADDRFEGYLQAMVSAGFESLVRKIPSAMGMPEGYAAAAALLADHDARPTAIVAVCDEVAIGAIVAARRLGISVPAELSVIGVDGHEHAEMFGLTTMVQHPEVIGERAVQSLIALIESDAERPTTPARVTLPTQLVVRSSTAPIGFRRVT